jgi:uncharacterized protein GlcG (DUF336 family)
MQHLCFGRKRLALTGAAVLLVSFVAAAQAQQANPAAPARQPAAPGPATELALEAAQVAINACKADGGQRIAVSVVDSKGVLKLLLTADGASPRGVSSSTAKALTALKYQQATQQLHQDKNLAAEIAKDSTLNARPGGVLLQAGDEIIGALGIGCGKTDHACAQAAVAAIQARLQKVG